jgi:hypothetical protein
MIKIISMSVIATCAITAFTVPAPAYAENFLNKVFGGNKQEEQKGPPPEVTLQAPFPTDTAPSAQGSSTSKLMGIYGTTDAPVEDANDLSKPHRNEKQITEWATEIVSQAMTINVKTYDNDFKKIYPAFTPYALKEYQDYLQKTNMMNVLSSNSFRLQAVSDEEGAVIKDGAISGTYHWLVQVPLMTSFYNEEMQTVDKTVTAQSQNLMVQVQVGRVAPKNNADIGLVVERWSVSSNAKK